MLSVVFRCKGTFFFPEDIAYAGMKRVKEERGEEMEGR